MGSHDVEGTGHLDDPTGGEPMFTRSVGRAVRVSTLIAVVAGPLMAAAQGATGSSGASGGTGSSGASGGTGSTASSGASKADAGTSHMPPSPAAMQKMKPSELGKMMDKDKDGFVTKEEFLKFQEQVFDSWDKSHTGRLAAPVFTDAG
jgi:hypothetical protein